MLNRDEIIEFLRNYSEPKEYVNAMWLEGADGINKVDKYSDIDFWFDVNKEHQESFLYECIEGLSKLGEIDSKVESIRREIAQSNIHLSNTSKYLTLDICVQSHEIRGKESTSFVKNDIAELPLVIFDKKNIIYYKEEKLDIDEIKEVFDDCKNRIKQSSRVEKYIKRNMYLEAYMKYIDNIASPIVSLARLVYTPNHIGYELCHISDHLPSNEVKKLEKFYKVSNFADIADNIKYAQKLLEIYEKKIREKYNI